MHLGEAMTYVLKTKGQTILQGFWKEDLVGILSDVISNGARIFDGSRDLLKNVSLKDLPGNILQSSQEIIHISWVMPGRIKKGLSDFQNDLVYELDNRKDPKEKALFCFKVFGVLSSSTISTLYNIPVPGKGKLRIRSAFAKFLIAEFILRSLRTFIGRFLNEVEKELTLEADIEHVRYFRRLMEGGEIAGEQFETSTEDPAFRMADKFRYTILNGDDET